MPLKRAAMTGKGARMVLAGLPLCLTVGAFAAVPAPRGAVSPGAAASPSPTYGCQVFHDKRAEPASVPLGEDVEITLTVRAECVPHHAYTHLALVIDQSQAMTGKPLRDVKEHAKRLVERLGLGAPPNWAYVTVVSFDDRARILTPLTTDKDRVARALDSLDAGGGARIDLGMEEARRAILAGRRLHPSDWGSSDWTTEASVLYSLGRPTDGCAAAERASIDLQRQGILSVTVCAGRTCNRQCLSDLASSYRYACDVGDVVPGHLFDVLPGAWFRNAAVSSLNITDTLSPDMSLVEGSVLPAPAATDPAGRWVAWHDTYVPKDGLTYTLRARPARTGALTTNELAEGHAVSNEGQVVDWQFEQPTVVVFMPSTRPTSRATPTPTLTPLPTPTGSETPSSTPVAVYLPRLGR